MKQTPNVLNVQVMSTDMSHTTPWNSNLTSNNNAVIDSKLSLLPHDLLNSISNENKELFMLDKYYQDLLRKER